MKQPIFRPTVLRGAGSVTKQEVNVVTFARPHVHIDRLIRDQFAARLQKRDGLAARRRFLVDAVVERIVEIRHGVKGEEVVEVRDRNVEMVLRTERLRIF